MLVQYSEELSFKSSWKCLFLWNMSGLKKIILPKRHVSFKFKPSAKFENFWILFLLQIIHAMDVPSLFSSSLTNNTGNSGVLILSFFRSNGGNNGHWRINTRDCPLCPLPISRGVLLTCWDPRKCLGFHFPHWKPALSLWVSFPAPPLDLRVLFRRETTSLKLRSWGTARRDGCEQNGVRISGQWKKGLPLTPSLGFVSG